MKFKVGDRVRFRHINILKIWNNCAVIEIVPGYFSYRLECLVTGNTGLAHEDELESQQAYDNEQEMRKLLGVEEK